MKDLAAMESVKLVGGKCGGRTVAIPMGSETAKIRPAYCCWLENYRDSGTRAGELRVFVPDHRKESGQ